jgi:hypothetical protein
MRIENRRFIEATNCLANMGRGQALPSLATRDRSLPHMVDPLSLRREAALYRRLASVPTSGGWNADRLLIAIAGRLEQKAAAAERNEESAGSPGLAMIRVEA